MMTLFGDEMKFKVVIEEEKDGGFSVYIPELPGCTSQGNTVNEALKNIKKALKLYLWSLKEDKRTLKKRRVLIKDIAA